MYTVTRRALDYQVAVYAANTTSEPLPSFWDLKTPGSRGVMRRFWGLKFFSGKVASHFPLHFRPAKILCSLMTGYILLHGFSCTEHVEKVQSHEKNQGGIFK
jgi:hypothetical protein